MSNLIVHRLGNGEPRRVLLLLPGGSDLSAQRLAEGIARYIAQHEPWEIYYESRRAPSEQNDFLPESAYAWDGIISGHPSAQLARECVRRRLPLVTLRSDAALVGVPNITIDDLGVGHLAAEYLIDHGLVHFGYYGEANHKTSIERLRGFLQKLQCQARLCHVEETPALLENDPGAEARETERLIPWLKVLPKPIGILTACDQRGARVLRAAKRARLRVPDDIMVLGANDEGVACNLAVPPLSSVAINEVECGFQAAEVLHRLMEGEAVKPEYRIRPAGVTARASTELLAVKDERIASALRYIHQHGCEAITVADICRHSGIARTQLEQKFRFYFSRSPQAEIRRVRLARIRQLLHDTDLPLRTIAELTGFDHVEYLSVFWKKALGESPGRYRRRVRATGIPRGETVGAAAAGAAAMNSGQ